MSWFRGVASSVVVALPAIGLAGTVQADGYAAPAAVYERPADWTGIYGGFNAGWSRTNYDWAFNPPVAGGAHQAYSLDTDRGVVGVHAGYQHQFGAVVVGVEGSYQLGTGNWAIENGYGINPAIDSYARMSHLFTVGPRLGIAAGHWMPYVTGGYAHADIVSQGISNVTPGGGLPFQPASNDHGGWFAGGGVEVLLGKNAFIGLEYKHVALDSERHCPTGTCTGAAGGFNDRDIKADADIVTARLSFKWGREDRAVPLK